MSRGGKFVAALTILAVSTCAFADDAGLKTFEGWELSGQWSRYKYDEPSEMHERGNKRGISGAYTSILEDDYFLSISLRLATGKNTYVGSGIMGDIPDTLWETRLVAGNDFAFAGFAFSPYLGIGYRVLYNDARGVTSTGALGYRRLSQYWYVPVGLIHRVALSFDRPARIATTVEYDYFLSGKQTSYLSDTGLGYPNVSNDQRGGYGLRASVAYEMRYWAVGVFANYWKVPISDPDVFFVGAAYYVGWEPDNNSRERGVFVKYRF